MAPCRGYEFQEVSQVPPHLPLRTLHSFSIQLLHTQSLLQTLNHKNTHTHTLHRRFPPLPAPFTLITTLSLKSKGTKITACTHTFLQTCAHVCTQNTQESINIQSAQPECWPPYCFLTKHTLTHTEVHKSHSDATPQEYKASEGINSSQEFYWVQINCTVVKCSHKNTLQGNKMGARGLDIDFEYMYIH